MEPKYFNVRSFNAVINDDKFIVRYLSMKQ